MDHLFVDDARDDLEETRDDLHHSTEFGQDVQNILRCVFVVDPVVRPVKVFGKEEMALFPFVCVASVVTGIFCVLQRTPCPPRRLHVIDVAEFFNWLPDFDSLFFDFDNVEPDEVFAFGVFVVLEIELHRQLILDEQRISILENLLCVQVGSPGDIEIRSRVDGKEREVEVAQECFYLLWRFAIWILPFVALSDLKAPRISFQFIIFIVFNFVQQLVFGNIRAKPLAEEVITGVNTMSGELFLAAVPRSVLQM